MTQLPYECQSFTYFKKSGSIFDTIASYHWTVDEVGWYDWITYDIYGMVSLRVKKVGADIGIR